MLMQSHRIGKTILLAASLALPFTSCAPLAERNWMTLEQIERIQEANSRYLVSVAKSDSSLIQPLKKSLGKSISNMLKSADSSNSVNEDLAQFSEEQLIRVYYLLKALQTQTFRETIGKELEKDTKDKSREHGGALRLLGAGRVLIEMIPGDRLLEASSSNGSFSPDNYYMPKKSQFSTTLLLPFHFHSQTEDESKRARFSLLDMASYIATYSNQALFSRLSNRRFKVDVGLWTGEMIEQQAHLDLGVYRY